MNRKDEHLHNARSQQLKTMPNDFDEVRLVASSFPKAGSSTNKVDLTTNFGELTLTSPFYLNAMTGGSALASSLNERLGIISRELDLMLALGSLSAGLKDPELLESYRIARKINPQGFIWLNLSADSSVEKVLRGVDALQANGVQLHLNLPQELVMPEGDRNFNDWLSNIALIQEQLNLPVLVKETGFGMSPQTLALLAEAGVEYVDVSGRGGTNFIAIENARRVQHEYRYLTDYGLSTVESLLNVAAVPHSFKVTASGGIRQPIDMVKALMLGADATAIAGTLLPTLMKEDGLPATLALLQGYQEQLRHLYVLLGVTTTAELKGLPLLFSEKINNYQQQLPKFLPSDS
ncbi:type 2 isopentenyl-diphosphate Delta-isomerase [Enterococcus nangangensis]|uniref:type 2 isopentenyl-diphosphate Delta-isomerase n=1 Tax=Enterococcus nangangensis TaxID=2559926 RepID=UPI0010F6FD57|nr:type 2 isopentenyl-diphosphate Delta-isomerase [Enterococcus nangangensis]